MAGAKERAPHSELLLRRLSMPGNDPRQNELAAQEHRAFAREWTGESPILAPLSLAFAIPGYSAAKLAAQTPLRHLMPASFSSPETTAPSFREMGQAYKGVGEGISDVLRDKQKRLVKYFSGL